MKEELMLNVATIGTNFIIDWFLKSVQDNQGIRCCAMYTRKKEHAEKLAEKYHIEMIYTDLDEMLSNPEIDIIYIASPNSLHYTYAEKALTAGKHVFCEKPLVSDNEQCAKLYELAEKKQRFLFEAIVTLHAPNYHLIREYLLKLGDIKLIQSNFSQYSSRYDAYLRGENPNVFSPEFSGGALADIGIYCLHFIVGLFGLPKQCAYYPNLGPNGIDTSGSGILCYGDYTASFSCAKDSESTCITQIQGTKGAITLYSQPSKCSRFTFHDRCSKETSEPSIEQEDNVLYYEVKEFVRIINENDLSAYRALSQESKDVMQVYETLRKGAHIHFSDDEK